MPKLSMSPPTRGEVLTILDEGQPKHGWLWMEAGGRELVGRTAGNRSDLAGSSRAAGLPDKAVERHFRGWLYADAEVGAVEVSPLMMRTTRR